MFDYSDPFERKVREIMDRHTWKQWLTFLNIVVSTWLIWLSRDTAWVEYTIILIPNIGLSLVFLAIVRSQLTGNEIVELVRSQRRELYARYNPAEKDTI